MTHFAYVMPVFDSNNDEMEMSFWLHFHHWLHPEVVKMTTSNAASAEKFVKMTFPSVKDADDTESI